MTPTKELFSLRDMHPLLVIVNDPTDVPFVVNPLQCTLAEIGNKSCNHVCHVYGGFDLWQGFANAVKFDATHEEALEFLGVAVS